MRIIVGLALLVLASLTLYEALYAVLPGRMSDLLLNLGTEFIGIVITVAIVDYLLERRKRTEEVQKIALQCLHDIDHHFWVWQGGSREFDMYELMELVSSVTNDDELAHYTETLFLVLGSKASNTLRTRPDEIKHSKSLKAALTLLSELCTIRDHGKEITPERIAEIVQSALPEILIAGGISISQLPPSYVVQKDCSFDKQEWRHYGRR